MHREIKKLEEWTHGLIAAEWPDSRAVRQSAQVVKNYIFKIKLTHNIILLKFCYTLDYTFLFV